ncbi:Zinc finger protein 235 [Plakobranchus ocellatus]|uniref:Zinc finger protein 235 n=1 Tax=Plakobranchus ocellatus TaxID=259542 RepID=A0AAV4CEE4_9GAST|nr:Zinc finger protein 235 [Plakobranchus ocellatus]
MASLAHRKSVEIKEVTTHCEVINYLSHNFWPETLIANHRRHKNKTLEKSSKRLSDVKDSDSVNIPKDLGSQCCISSGKSKGQKVNSPFSLSKHNIEQKPCKIYQDKSQFTPSASWNAQASLKNNSKKFRTDESSTKTRDKSCALKKNEKCVTTFDQTTTGRHSSLISNNEAQVSMASRAGCHENSLKHKYSSNVDPKLPSKKSTLIVEDFPLAEVIKSWSAKHLKRQQPVSQFSSLTLGVNEEDGSTSETTTDLTSHNKRRSPCRMSHDLPENKSQENNGIDGMEIQNDNSSGGAAELPDPYIQLERVDAPQLFPKKGLIYEIATLRDIVKKIRKIVRDVASPQTLQQERSLSPPETSKSLSSSAVTGPGVVAVPEDSGQSCSVVTVPRPISVPEESRQSSSVVTVSRPVVVLVPKHSGQSSSVVPMPKPVSTPKGSGQSYNVVTVSRPVDVPKDSGQLSSVVAMPKPVSTPKESGQSSSVVTVSRPFVVLKDNGQSSSVVLMPRSVSASKENGQSSSVVTVSRPVVGHKEGGYCRILRPSENFFKEKESLLERKKHFTRSIFSTSQSLRECGTEKSTTPSTNKQIYKCSVCFYRFSSAGRLQAHFKMKHKAEVRMKQKPSHKENSHSGAEGFHAMEDKNGTLTESFRSADFLKVQKRKSCASKKSAMKNCTCKICGKSFVRVSNLNVHYKIHTNKKPYSCRFCQKSFRIKFSLERHENTHGGEKCFSCDVCGKAFRESGHLYRHKLIHSEEKPHVCALCGKGFVQASDLQRHYRTHTGEMPFKCDTCGKKYREKGSLDVHQRCHRGEKPFSCHICSKRFTYYSGLYNHMKVHSDQKPFICDVCNKAFTRYNKLKAHKLIHTGEKPFKCETCHSSFRQSSGLSTHVRTHSGLRPYICSYCGRKFREKLSKISHERTHTGERPYKCKKCGRAYCQMTSLYRHLKLKHSGGSK